MRFLGKENVVFSRLSGFSLLPYKFLGDFWEVFGDFLGDFWESSIINGLLVFSFPKTETFLGTFWEKLGKIQERK